MKRFLLAVVGAAVVLGSPPLIQQWERHERTYVTGCSDDELQALDHAEAESRHFRDQLEQCVTAGERIADEADRRQEEAQLCGDILLDHLQSEHPDQVFQGKTLQRWERWR